MNKQINTNKWNFLMGEKLKFINENGQCNKLD